VRRLGWPEDAAAAGRRAAGPRHRILVDLEDSVAAAHKEAARAAAEAYFTAAGEVGCQLALRINSPASADGLQDLLAASAYCRRPAMVLVPKVESARDIEIVAGALDGDDYTPELYAVIETPRGIGKLASIAQAPRLGGLVFGAADYALQTGTGLRWAPLAFARSALVNAAGSAGLPAIDSPYFDVRDLEGLRREARLAKALGFCGKVAVHPRQVPVINAAFLPSEQEIDRARAIVAAGQSTGMDVAAIDGQMVGAPFFAAANALIDQVDADERGRRPAAGARPR
jgi:citrate lyase subunit beta/citryl-CoA lyase/(S)-citramalyl-CoA lyase